MEELLKKIWETRRWEAAIVFAAFVLAVAARVWYALYVRTEQLYDFATYYQLALNIYNGQGHTLNGVANAWTGPGYPYALALFFKLCGGASETAAKAFNIALSAGTIALAYPILVKLVKNVRIRLFVFFIIAFLPMYVAYVNVVGTELFFVFLLTALLFAQLYFSKYKAANAVVGLLCGALALTKPFMLVYPVICGCMYWIQTKNLKKTIAFFAITAAAAIAAIAPWTFRNYKSFGRFIPISYNMGYNMYINDNSSNKTGAWMDISRVEKSPEAEALINEYLKNGERSIKEAHDLEPFLKAEAVKWIKAHPLQFLKLGVLRVRQSYFMGANDVAQWARNAMTYENIGGGTSPEAFNRVQIIIQLGYDAVFTALCAIGLLFFAAHFWNYAVSFFTRKMKTDALSSVAFINIAFFTVVIVMFEGQARYAFPVFFFMILAVAKIAERGISIIKRRA